MDYVQPTDLLNDATKAASRKASLSVRDLLIRSFLAGGLLAYATSLVFIVLSQNVVPIVGAILFPVGFVILVLLGLELATGNFALLPMGWAAGEVSFLGMLRNLGNNRRCRRTRTAVREILPNEVAVLNQRAKQQSHRRRMRPTCALWDRPGRYKIATNNCPPN